MRKILVLLALLLPSALLLAEDIRVAHIFSDHMVLQRESAVPVWGWGDPGAKVTVTTSWNAAKAEAKVGQDGTWRLYLQTGEAGGPYTVTVKSGNKTITLEDVLLGEVWVCSGQSNMEMPVGGFGFQ